MKRLGVDPGQRRIGLAVADGEVAIAVPFGTVRGGPGGVERVAEVAREQGVDALVVGLPLKMDGTEGTAARRARAFARELGQATGLPVFLWDERLTTVAAERTLREMGVRGRDRRRVVDQGAATVMLQSYLDAPAGARSEERWRDEGNRAGRDGDGGADDPPGSPGS